MYYPSSENKGADQLRGYREDQLCGYREADLRLCFRICKNAKISFAVTAKLICVFVFAYAKFQFSHNEAHVCVGGRQVDIERVGSSLEVGG